MAANEYFDQDAYYQINYFYSVPLCDDSYDLVVQFAQDATCEQVAQSLRISMSKLRAKMNETADLVFEEGGNVFFVAMPPVNLLSKDLGETAQLTEEMLDVEIAKYQNLLQVQQNAIDLNNIKLGQALPDKIAIENCQRQLTEEELDRLKETLQFSQSVFSYRDALEDLVKQNKSTLVLKIL